MLGARLACSAFFLFTTLFSLSSSTYNTEYVEPECQNQRAIVYQLRSYKRFTALILKPRRKGYGEDNNCNITVSASNIAKGHVLLSIRRIDFDNPHACNNYLRIYNGTAFINKLCGNIDYDSASMHFTAPRADFMEFNFHTDTSSIFHDGFEVLATAYTDGPCRGNFDFRCRNHNCISNSLRCDGYNNCGDNSDETNGKPANCKLGAGAVAAIVIGVLLFIAVVSGVLWFCQRKWTRVRIVTHQTSASAVNPTVQQGYQQSPVGIQNPTYGTPPSEPLPPYSK